MNKIIHLKNDFTATGYLMNRGRSKMLFVYHKKLRKWVPPGGHLEDNELPHECVLREAFEETGIRAEFLPNSVQINKLSRGEKQLPTPYCILHEVIPTYKTTPKHMHVDFIYLLIARTNKTTISHESMQIGWFTKKEIKKLDCFQAAKSVSSRELKS